MNEDAHPSTEIRSIDIVDRRALEAIRADIKRDNVQRALNRLSDLIEAQGASCEKHVRRASIVLMQEYHRVAQWKINNSQAPEVISRFVQDISIRALELCDALEDGDPPVKLSPGIIIEPVDNPPVRPTNPPPYRGDALAGPDAESVVHAQGVSRIFKKSGFQLEPLDLRLKPGQILAIVGMNGSGKSTLIDILRGAAAPDRGRVSYPLLSRGNNNWRAVRSQIGYVAQRSPPWRGSVVENLEYAAAIHGIVGDNNSEWTSRLIARHGLTLYKDRAWPELSAGFRMRFDLALARISRPRLLILDEPLGNLDIVSQQSFLFDLKQLAKVAGETSIIITSQHLFEIEAIADDLILLAGGRKIGTSTPTHSHFEVWWPKSVTISEESIYKTLEQFEILSLKVGTTSCLISLRLNTTLDELVTSVRGSGLQFSYVRDVTRSVLIDMHRVAALDEERPA